MLRTAGALVSFAALILLVPVFRLQVQAGAGDECTKLNQALYGVNGGGGVIAALRRDSADVTRFREKLKRDEEDLDGGREQQATYFVEHGKTDAMLEWKLRNMTQGVDESRRTLAYYKKRENNDIREMNRIGLAMSSIRGCHEWEREAPPEPSAGPREDWNGTYVGNNGASTMSISGQTNSLVAKMEWTQPGATHGVQGSDDTATCKVREYTANCTTQGQYHDADKEITYKGSSELTLSGNKVTVVETIVSTVCDAKKVPDCEDLGYTPTVSKGAKFTTTYTRR
jgi:hypothetical protein